MGCCLSATSQYTYFNQLSLESGLEFGNYDTSTNLEVVGDELIVWGGQAINGIPYLFVRRFDSSGVEIEESTFNFGDSLIYIGGTNSFLSIPNSDGFLFSHAMYSDGIGEGIIMKFSSTLDTVWSKTYNEYFPETYFYTHATSENGFVIAGEYGPELGERGTFIMEIDPEGEVLWHNEIHAPEEGLFRNRSISQHDDKFIVSGVDQAGDNQSYIEIVSEDGILEEHIEPPNTPIGGGGSLYHFINSLDEIIVYQSAAYEWITPPSVAYNKIRVFNLDVDGVQLTLENEYFANNELSGSVSKMIEVSDGYAISGWYRDFDNGNSRKAWIMKIDDDFQQEWYTELSYDDAPGNAHLPL